MGNRMKDRRERSRKISNQLATCLFKPLNLSSSSSIFKKSEILNLYLPLLAQH